MASLGRDAPRGTTDRYRPESSYPAALTAAAPPVSRPGRTRPAASERRSRDRTDQLVVGGQREVAGLPPLAVEPLAGELAGAQVSFVDLAVTAPAVQPAHSLGDHEGLAVAGPPSRSPPSSADHRRRPCGVSTAIRTWSPPPTSTPALVSSRWLWVDSGGAPNVRFTASVRGSTRRTGPFIEPRYTPPRPSSSRRPCPRCCRPRPDGADRPACRARLAVDVVGDQVTVSRRSPPPAARSVDREVPSADGREDRAEYGAAGGDVEDGQQRASSSVVLLERLEHPQMSTRSGANISWATRRPSPLTRSTYMRSRSLFSGCRNGGPSSPVSRSTTCIRVPLAITAVAFAGDHVAVDRVVRTVA